MAIPRAFVLVSVTLIMAVSSQSLPGAAAGAAAVVAPSGFRIRKVEGAASTTSMFPVEPVIGRRAAVRLTSGVHDEA